MKTTFFAICIGIFCIAMVSCIMGGRALSLYYIYITGDSGRTVQISYLDTDSHGDQNVRLTEKVQLPFFKEAGYNVGLRIKDDDAFLEIVSENDVTTKAIIFDNSLLLADSICPAFYVFETGYANYSEKCAYCVSLPKDSVLNYLKDARYPCYLEFAKGETIKKVRLDDLFQWRPYE